MFNNLQQNTKKIIKSSWDKAKQAVQSLNTYTASRGKQDTIAVFKYIRVRNKYLKMVRSFYQERSSQKTISEACEPISWAFGVKPP